ncbi:MAG: EAL domain-containing protein [Gammaproteobacteria bacterium]|nr:EAL domain-containing protein [Gammaproteobacteria bacterium]NIX84389.1 EAL domain-containing protein [Gammaproteobacteria bacterium]
MKVLLVEDNPAEAHLIRDTLSRARGYRFAVEHVQRMQAALERLPAEGLDVILLDLFLPDAGGLPLFREVHRHAPHVPVVILTNMQDEEVAATAVREGAQDYLLKRELEPNLLLRAIRYAIERQHAEESLRESAERYALAVSGANDGVWDWNITNDRVYFSPRWKTMLGYRDAEIGDDVAEWFDRVHPADIEGLKSALYAHLRGGADHFAHEHRIHTRASGYLWVLSRGLAVRDETGTAYRMAGSLTDISARKRAEQQLLHDAMHDSLTGLPNRGLFLDRLDLALRQHRRDEEKLFAVLFFDLDRFKHVNDSLGHSTGDELLMSVTHRLKKFLRPGDTLARFGGDEFAVLLTDVTSVTDATHVAVRIHELLSQPFIVRGHEALTSASVGIALGSKRYERPEEVLRDADLAMYRAKSAGKACYEVFDSALYEHEMGAVRLESELRRAVEREEFLMHYQPIVALESGRIVGLEGLIRWNHPEQGLMSPHGFLPLAEEKDIIVPIEWWALRETCRQMRRWQECFPADPPLYVSINIPGKLFVQSGMAQRIRAILDESGLAPESLRLDITENAIMNHGDLALARLRELRELGIQVHVDDFGTGYSSLTSLQRFSYHSLKIDRSFVSSLDTGGSRAVVKTMVTLGQTLGMNVIAEGVETEEQLRQLREMSCPQAQGYWFSQPLDIYGVESLLARTLHSPSIQK